jgi:hypothetical protein
MDDHKAQTARPQHHAGQINRMVTVIALPRRLKRRNIPSHAKCMVRRKISKWHLKIHGDFAPLVEHRQLFHIYQVQGPRPHTEELQGCYH